MRNCAVVALLLLFTSGSLGGAVTLGPRHRDESNGFQIQLPQKWEQVPTKFNEVVVVGKWAAKRAKRGAWASELRVLRFVNPDREAAGEAPARGSGEGIPGAAGMMRNQPKDVWEYIERIPFRSKPELVDDRPEYKLTRSKTQKAHLRVYQSKAGGSGRDAAKSQIMIVAASIEPREPGEATYGVVFISTVADARDTLRPFKIAIRRFRILDPAEEDEEEAGSSTDIFVDSTKKPKAWREARKKKLGSLKDWSALDTDHYLIVYNRKVKRRLLRKIAKHIEAIRAQIYEKLFPPAHEVKAVSVVRVCKDMAEYHRYGGPAGSAGYWSRGDEELVIPGNLKRDSLRVLYHEAFHQYIHYAVGDVAPHSWFNEGHGDYFAGHNYRGRKFRSAAFKWRTGIIANAFATKTYVPLKKFLKYTQREYYANAGLCYAEGWSLIYFLREIELRKVKRYKQYWGLLDRYFDAIKRNVKTVKEKAFEGLDGDEKKPKEGGEPKGGDGDNNPANEGAGPGAEGDDTEQPPAGLPRLPGLDTPFPGEHPEAGAAPDPATRAAKETKTVAGPKITGVKSALDAAVDETFGRLDIDQLEKDWIAWSK